MIPRWLFFLAAIASAASPRRLDSVEVATDPPSWMAGPLDSLEGAPLSREETRKALEEAVGRAEARGFLLASASADSLDSRGVLHLSARAGRRFVWTGVGDRGASRLRPPTLSRLSRIGTGQDADPARMESARRRILATGYVEEVSGAAISLVPRTSGVRMLLDLRDLPSSFVEGAGGWSQDEDAAGAVEIHLADLAGTARDLSFGIRQGGASLSSHGRWKEPWIGPFEVEAVASGELDQDSLFRRWKLSVDLGWSFLDGLAALTTGMSTARSAEAAPGDTVFGPELAEWTSRLGCRWQSAPPVAWPVHETRIAMDLEAGLLQADTGTSGRLRLEGQADLRRSLGPSVWRSGIRARGIWPLDRSAGASETRAIGGLHLWRGWPEGSPRTPSWILGVLEAAVGSPANGGTGLFWEPGTMARRNPDLSWSWDRAWTSGTFATLFVARWQVDLVVSVRDDTPGWNEALLSVRAINRF